MWGLLQLPPSEEEPIICVYSYLSLLINLRRIYESDLGPVWIRIFLKYTKFGSPQTHQKFCCKYQRLSHSLYINSLSSFHLHTPGFFYNELLLYEVTNFYLIAKFNVNADFHLCKYKLVIIMLITLTQKVGN